MQNLQKGAVNPAVDCLTYTARKKIIDLERSNFMKARLIQALVILEKEEKNQLALKDNLA